MTTTHRRGAASRPVLPSPPVGPKAPTRYHGTVRIDPSRAGRDAGRIADEVLAHLVGLVRADVTVTLEIEATSRVARRTTSSVRSPRTAAT